MGRRFKKQQLEPVQVPLWQEGGRERGERAGGGRIQHQPAVGSISLATVCANSRADSLKRCSDQLLAATDRLRGERHETDTSGARAKHTGSLIRVLIPAPCSPPPALPLAPRLPRSASPGAHLGSPAFPAEAPAGSCGVPGKARRQPRVPARPCGGSGRRGCCRCHPLRSKCAFSGL